MTRSTERLAERLLAYYAELVRGVDSSEGREAWDEARDLVRSDPAEAWTLIVAILPKLPPAATTYLAAGPLEDLIDFFPEDAVERIESRAWDERLREALAEVIVGPWVSPSIVERLREINPEIRHAAEP